jgi:chromosome condensin MukBEF MukE localization factor
MIRDGEAMFTESGQARQNEEEQGNDAGQAEEEE